MSTSTQLPDFFDSASQEALTFLGEFFRDDYNSISISTVEASEELRDLVQPLLGEDPRPTVLPFRSQRDYMYWFGIVRTPRELYAQQANLQAFVGPTYANIRKGRERFTKDTSFSRALNDFTNGLGYYFQGRDGAILREVRRYLNVRRQKPSRDIPESRSTGLLLRDFDTAAQAGHRDRAAAILQFLRSRNRLGGLNLVYLQIRLHAAFLEWQDLLDLESINQVGSLRQRPSIVSDDILRAIYHVHLKDVVHQGEFEEIEERLHRAAESPGPVWSSRIGLQSSAAWTTYGLAAGLLRGDQKAVERAADAVAKQDGDRNILLRLLENLPDGETESAGVPHPFEAFQNRQYDVALEGAREMSPGLQRTELLLFIANCVDQRPILKEALSAAEDLDLDQRAKLNPLAKDALEKIRDQISSAEARIQGWMDLLVSIRDHNLSHAQVLRTAREERITWDLDSLVGDPDILVDTLADIPESQKPTLRSVLPYIVEDLLSDPNYPDRSLRDVYDLILIVIIEDPSPDPESISNVVDLFPGVLGLLTKKDYQERAEEAASMLDRVTARIDPSQALDFLDVLIAHPAPDPRPRQSAFTKVNELRERNPEDWNREHHRFLRKLALEGGLENLIPPVPDVQESESTETDPLGWLRGKYVGIYTLNESAGRRAEKEIRSRVNDVDVRRSNAHQSTESLVAMSKNSDVMVVVTRQATHAATDAITSNLGPETELVRPKGGGTRSIIAELETGPEGD